MADQPLPKRYVFELYRGDTRVWEHRFAEDPAEDGTPGDPIDITGWTFLAKYRLTTEDPTVIAVDAMSITDGPGGVLRRTLTATESAKLPKGRVSWDLQATKPDNTVRTWLFNNSIKVDGDTTR